MGERSVRFARKDIGARGEELMASCERRRREERFGAMMLGASTRLGVALL
jgi:hypothetical protein